VNAGPSAVNTIGFTSDFIAIDFSPC